MKYFDYLKSIVYIRPMHIFANSEKSTFPISAEFFPKGFKGHSELRSFLFV